MSARAVLEALDPERFEAVPLGIDRQGRWLLPQDARAALALGPGGTRGKDLAVRPGASGALLAADGSPARLDVIFPVLHGPNGEDGTIQGLLELCGIPYVGAGVLGSALGMDKIAQKDAFVRHGLPTPAYLGLRRSEWSTDRNGVLARVEAALSLPCFVKPANLGSSVGISMATTREELAAGLDAAAVHGRRIICEQAVPGCREVECGVLGNEHPTASVLGEVIPHARFYDYASKYTDGGADLVIPAELPSALAERMRAMALEVFRVLDLAGMARVDFFVSAPTQEVFVNEVNTIPGFTSHSMFPRLWSATGLPYADLLARLVQLALERHAEAGAGGPEGGTA